MSWATKARRAIQDTCTKLWRRTAIQFVRWSSDELLDLKRLSISHLLNSLYSHIDILYAWPPMTKIPQRSLHLQCSVCSLSLAIVSAYGNMYTPDGIHGLNSVAAMDTGTATRHYSGMADSLTQAEWQQPARAL